MSVYRILILTLVVFVSNSFAFDHKQSNVDSLKIKQSIVANGSSIVIVGLSDPAAAKTLSSSSVISKKTAFLRSGAVAKSLISKSMQVVDELENLPFIILKVDMKGFQSLETHNQVITIEADRELKASLKTAVPKIAGFSNPWVALLIMVKEPGWLSLIVGFI